MMEKPTVEQIKQIVLNLTESDDPIVHRSTLEKYFTPTAAFQHPIVNVKPAPRSLDHIKQVYAVYKVLLSDIKINFDHITIDADNTRAIVELTEDFNFVLLPFGFARVHGLRFLTVLDLVREEREGGKYYISRQYDITPIDSTLKILPFGFLYSWCQDICTLTGSVVGSALQMAGLWPTA